MQKFSAYLLYALFIVCCTAINCIGQTIVPSSIQQDPPQYQMPFNNVPDRRDAIIYQVNIRSFSTEGNLKGVVKRLDSIKALGVNVIYLMPVYPVGQIKAVNSPYCVKDYLAVNSEFGTLIDLRAVVDGAHNRNMAVILDWVPNHTSFDNTWTQNKAWYLQDSAGNIISPPGMGWNDVAQLNYNNSDMRLAMIKAMKYWIYTANIDGFRCDYSDGPPVDFWKQAIDTLRNISTHKLLILAEGSRSTNYAAGFDYNFGFKFFGNLKGIYEHNKSVKSIDSLNISDYSGAEEGQQIIRYITNHDVNGSDVTPIELFGGEKGSMAAFVVIAYMKGIPMIYNGQEVGTPFRLTFPFTSKKIDWTPKPFVTDEYKKILAFRNSSEAIRRGELVSYSNADVCAFAKQINSEKVFVIVNLRNRPVRYEIPAVYINSDWEDIMIGTKVSLSSTITLEPFSYLVLKK